MPFRNSTKSLIVDSVRRECGEKALHDGLPTSPPCHMSVGLSSTVTFPPRRTHMRAFTNTPTVLQAGGCGAHDVREEWHGTGGRTRHTNTDNYHNNSRPPTDDEHRNESINEHCSFRSARQATSALREQDKTQRTEQLTEYSNECETVIYTIYRPIHTRMASAV